MTCLVRLDLLLLELLHLLELLLKLQDRVLERVGIRLVLLAFLEPANSHTFIKLVVLGRLTPLLFSGRCLAVAMLHTLLLYKRSLRSFGT